MNTDRIEKTILLRAPLRRVWRALADSTEFGAWFGMKFDGPFVAGAAVRGRIVPTGANAEAAKVQKQFEDMTFEIRVEQIEPERLLSLRWHPYAVERGVDYSSEPMTLVTFALEEAADGVML